MKSLVISYSYTGNNALLAKGIAEKTESDYLAIQEIKKRRLITIVLDVIFNRTPKIHQLQKKVENYDFIIYVAPIWFGKIATPFRQIFKHQKNNPINYAFVSISAGANGIFPTVGKELQKYLSKKPKVLIHHLISDLVPNDQRANRKLLDSYKLGQEDAVMLIDNTVHTLQKVKY